MRKRTLANLSKWPAEIVEGLRSLLKGGSVISDLSQAFQVQRTRPHGHVAAVLGTLRRLGLERLLATRNSLQRRLVVALIVARILEPRSKLATARGWDPQTLSSSLGELLQVEAATADDLYGALDWLLVRQPKIENQLAAQRLQDGCLVIYDVTSTYFEGRSCPLAQRGYSRDGKGGTLQIVFGLLCERLPRRGRGLRRQPSGPHNSDQPNPKTAPTLRVALGGGGRRSRNADGSPHSGGAQAAARHGLDHGPARPSDPQTVSIRSAAAVPV